MLSEQTDRNMDPECKHAVLRRVVWLGGTGWICADDDHPGCHYRIKQSEDPLCDQAKYWRARFIGMRRTYRERFSEGLTMQEWHAKHCAAFVASKRMQTAIQVIVDDLAQHIDRFVSADEMDRRLRPLLDRGPEEPPACSHDDAEPR